MWNVKQGIAGEILSGIVGVIRGHLQGCEHRRGQSGSVQGSEKFESVWGAARGPGSYHRGGQRLLSHLELTTTNYELLLLTTTTTTTTS